MSIWYQGNISEIIAEALTENKIVAIIAVTNNEQCNTFIQQLERDLSAVFTTTCTGIIIKEGTDNLRYFNELYDKKITFPSFFLFNNSGLFDVLKDERLNIGGITAAIIQCSMNAQQSMQLSNSINSINSSSNSNSLHSSSNINNKNNLNNSNDINHSNNSNNMININVHDETNEITERVETGEIRQRKEKKHKKKEHKEHKDEMIENENLSQFVDMKAFSNNQNNNQMNASQLKALQSMGKPKEEEDELSRRERNRKLLEEKQKADEMRERKEMLEMKKEEENYKQYSAQVQKKIMMEKEQQKQKQRAEEQRIREEEEMKKKEEDEKKEERKKYVQVMFRLPTGETFKYQFNKTDTINDCFIILEETYQLKQKQIKLVNAVKRTPITDFNTRMNAFYPSIVFHVVRSDMPTEVKQVKEKDMKAKDKDKKENNENEMKTKDGYTALDDGSSLMIHFACFFVLFRPKPVFLLP